MSSIITIQTHEGTPRIGQNNSIILDPRFLDIIINHKQAVRLKNQNKNFWPCLQRGACYQDYANYEVVDNALKRLLINLHLFYQSFINMTILSTSNNTLYTEYLELIGYWNLYLYWQFCYDIKTRFFLNLHFFKSFINLAVRTTSDTLILNILKYRVLRIYWYVNILEVLEWSS